MDRSFSSVTNNNISVNNVDIEINYYNFERSNIESKNTVLICHLWHHATNSFEFSINDK